MECPTFDFIVFFFYVKEPQKRFYDSTQSHLYSPIESKFDVKKKRQIILRSTTIMKMEFHEIVLANFEADRTSVRKAAEYRVSKCTVKMPTGKTSTFGWMRILGNSWRLEILESKITIRCYHKMNNNCRLIMT